MRVEPISANEANSGGGGEPFRPGEYDFIVQAAEETTSAKGNDMLKLTLHIYNQDGEKRTVFDYILSSKAGAWKARHLMEAISLTEQYEQGNMDPFVIEGRPGRCKVGIDPANAQYPAKNKVQDYLGNVAPAGTGYTGVSAPRAPSSLQKAPAGDIDDEVPF
jgi:Protein of unknown function (DUF669)